MPCGAPRLTWSRSQPRCRMLRSAESLRCSRSPPSTIGLLEACASAELCGQRQPLALGHRADRLALRKACGIEQPPAAHIAPLSLAHEHIGDRHALDIPWVAQDYLCGRYLAVGDTPLELGAGEADPVGAGEGLDALRRLDVD